AGVSAADDDDVLVSGGNRASLVQPRHVVAFATLIRFSQVLHREMDAFELATWYIQVPRRGGAAGQHDRVELASEIFHRHVAPDIAASPEVDTLVAHDLQTPIEEPLFHFEFRDAVAEKTADTIRALQYHDRVPGFVQLICRGQTCRSRS